MDVWMDGWMDVFKMDSLIEGWIYRWMVGRRKEWMDGLIDG